MHSAHMTYFACSTMRAFSSASTCASSIASPAVRLRLGPASSSSSSSLLLISSTSGYTRSSSRVGHRGVMAHHKR